MSGGPAPEVADALFARAREAANAAEALADVAAREVAQARERLTRAQHAAIAADEAAGRALAAASALLRSVGAGDASDPEPLVLRAERAHGDAEAAVTEIHDALTVRWTRRPERACSTI